MVLYKAARASAARRRCRLVGALALSLDLALLIDASAFGALGRVRSDRGSRGNIDGGTRYLAGVVDRYAHPISKATPRISCQNIKSAILLDCSAKTHLNKRNRGMVTEV